MNLRHCLAVSIPLLIALAPVASAASPRYSEVQSPPTTLQFQKESDPNVPEQLVRSLEATTASRKTTGVGTRVVAVDWAMPSFLIPAAGSLQGSGGTFFRSDVTLVNHGEDDQEILILWIPRGSDGRGQPAYRSTVPADARPITTRDFVGTLGLSGLGSLLITGVLPGTTTPDEDAVISGFSRIWTPQPGSSGTVSQPFTSQNADMFFDEFEAMSLGLQQDSAFRTNVGIVNLSPRTRSFIVYVLGEIKTASFTMTLPPLSMQQVAVPEGDYGAITIEYLSDDPEGGSWAAYGTSVDHVTGDGWVSPATLLY